MDTLPELKLIKFHPDTLTFMRKQYNLDKPGQMDQAIDILDHWIKKQNHFTVKEFPRNYLERQIILNKGSTERAKLQIEKLFTMKSILSHFYEKFDAKHDFPGLRESYIQAPMPKMTEDYYRVYCGKPSNDYVPEALMTCYNYFVLLLEYIRANEYCNGFVGVIDYRNMNMLQLVSDLDITAVRQFLKLLSDGYQTRVKAIHLLTTSKTIEVMVTLLKQCLSAKIGDRIQVHMTLETLHEHVPKELLPKDFGGDLKPLLDIYDDWVEEFSTKESLKFFEDMSKARVDEAYRCGTQLNKDDILGMAGSFRTLSVD